MSLQATPRSNRVHIALFGRRNAGKSSLINALTNQPLAVVSPIKGTTTDPVFKAMEFAPIGPTVLIDTAGLDDEGELGELRKKKTMEIVNRTDFALLVIDAQEGIGDFEGSFAAYLRTKKIPAIAVVNKRDCVADASRVVQEAEAKLDLRAIAVSAADKGGMEELRQLIGALLAEDASNRIASDLIDPLDVVVLVVPIDSGAPKGRLILPQQQTIRDVLDAGAVAVVARETELQASLAKLSVPPKLVITDSQVFSQVAQVVPESVWLTSFSILFARHKGDLRELIKGARTIRHLQDGDKVLIAEACTHHAQHDDIAQVKIPRWLNQATGRNLVIEYSSGFSYPERLEPYKLIIHCGGCMLNRRAMLNRIDQAAAAGVPIVNYGVLIAYLHGVFPRAIEMFPDVLQLWESLE